MNGDNFSAASSVRVEEDDAGRLVRVIDRDHGLLWQRVVVLTEVVLSKNK